MGALEALCAEEADSFAPYTALLWAEDEVAWIERGREPTAEETVALEEARARNDAAIEALQDYEPTTIQELATKARVLMERGYEPLGVLYEDILALAGARRSA